MIEASRVLERDAEPAWREALARYERDAEATLGVDKTWRDSVRAAKHDGAAPPDRPTGVLLPRPTGSSRHMSGSRTSARQAPARR